MKHFKRFGAILGIIVILAVFCIPMVFAFGSGENSQNAFKAALMTAIIFPIILYAFGMAYKIWGKKKLQEEKEIENIVFDVGNVLVKFGWEDYLKSFGFPKEKYEKIADAVFRSQTWNERDRSDFPEKEYVNRMVESAPEYEADIREVMRRSSECIKEMDYAQTWTKYLKEKGYHLYILSNYSTYMLEQTKKNMSFLKNMDGEIFSCDVKVIKPEPEIFQLLIERYQLNPQKTVFLDDRADNCEAAVQAGMKAIIFKDFKQAVAELEKFGVK